MKNVGAILPKNAYEKYANHESRDKIEAPRYIQLFQDAKKYHAVQAALADRLYKELHRQQPKQ